MPESNASDGVNYEGLGQLLRAAGVPPERVEIIVRDASEGVKAEASDAGLMPRILALVEAQEESLRAVRRASAGANASLDQTVRTCRHEAWLRHRYFIGAVRRTQLLLAAIVALQLVFLGCAVLAIAHDGGRVWTWLSIWHFLEALF